MNDTCINKEKFTYIETTQKKISETLEKTLDTQNQINIKTEIQDNSIREMKLKIDSLFSKLDKFNILLITNLIGLIFLILGGLGTSIFFIISYLGGLDK
jgi:cellulose synthase/poly-beta-1,6-N-acetylglucosamine synthase-like glycosyltransferase